MMHRPFWDPKLETLPVEQRATLRAHRLHWQVRRCWDGSPFYRARLEAGGIEPAVFGGGTDWARLPVLRASDLPAMPDWAVAPEAWWDHVDEGLGRDAGGSQPPRVVTDGDAIQAADLMARALWAAGARPGQAFPLPSAALHTQTRATIMAAAGRIGAALGGAGAPYAPAVLLPILAATPALQCQEGNHIHWNDDHFLIEIVEPSTGTPARSGDAGAVVITDLAREGSPLLRYWTALEAAISDEPCSCGRTSAWSRVVSPLAQG